MNAPVHLSLLGQLKELAMPSTHTTQIRTEGRTIGQLVTEWMIRYPDVAVLAWRHGFESCAGPLEHLAHIRTYGQMFMSRHIGVTLTLWQQLEANRYLQLNMHRGEDGFVAIATIRGRRLPVAYETATDKYLERMITAPLY